MLHRAAFGGVSRANRLVMNLSGPVTAHLKCLSSPIRRDKSSTTNDASVSDVASRVTQEPFLNGSSSGYLESMYNSWVEDPKSVHVSWDAFFANNKHIRPPTLFPGDKSLEEISALSTEKTGREIDDHLSVQAIIRSYQVGAQVMLFYL